MQSLRWFIIFLLLIGFVKLTIFSKFPNVLGIDTTRVYSIAIIGDSMVETMGEGLEYLDAALREKYPGVTFKLYNYGLGSQNVVEGLARFSLPFNHGDRDYPSLTHLHPDILIVGSFAYNPPFPYDSSKYKENLAKLVQEAINTQSQVYLLAEIAPLEKDFGKGEGGPNWPEELSRAQSTQIANNLENVITLVHEIPKVKLIDAYTATSVNGKFGDGRYTDSYDNIHPSKEGQIYVAELIAKSIKLRELRN
ncbi:SGNH/GDSL hydrolase family protein [Candidatus Microgenomates bacterium]|nr:SGNH/GDSL hydrolase family protein [Candidatus Microgenomates bacterium]